MWGGCSTAGGGPHPSLCMAPFPASTTWTWVTTVRPMPPFFQSLHLSHHLKAAVGMRGSAAGQAQKETLWVDGVIQGKGLHKS